MTNHPELIALRHALDTCAQHQDALRDALTDLERRRLQADELGKLSRADRRLLDQFAYRFTRIQDDMGARLFPAALRALGEDVSPMPAFDRLARLEQLGWLPDAERWGEMRRVRNEFTHDYPESLEERFARLELAIACALEAANILEHIRSRILSRFPFLLHNEPKGSDRP